MNDDKPRQTHPTPPITASATQTVAAAPAVTATPSPAPSSTATNARVRQGPGAVILPILLYHHIDESPSHSQYYVSPQNFESQMKLLRNWGYETVTTETLVQAINEGADLPPHPILITFDDGNLNNFTEAFPIMRRYNLGGVLYVVGNYIGAPGYMDAEQINEMARGGWEVGSHGMTHPDLAALNSQTQNYEIFKSRTFLEDKLGLPILTFAYPFGISTCGVNDKVYTAGYIAAMSLGSSADQCKTDLFNLHRLSVKGGDDLNRFAALLPWQGDPLYLPTNTPVPDSTQVPSH
ncbi:MAG: polysaccharide deacetylase family protein [Chloroflexi bacterium]|nr:polysaccharide deacetylase family protein [Chloroflexota bacterium]